MTSAQNSSPNELPDRLNAAAELIDSHVAAGRGLKPAILCDRETVTYLQLQERVNRFGNLLRQLGVRMEERVAFVLPDSPEWACVFFGAMKIGAVAVPMNTLLAAKDYQYLLNDSRAQVLVVHASLLDRFATIRPTLKHLRHIFVAGRDAGGATPEVSGMTDLPQFEAALAGASPELEAVDTSKDDMAFWLYSSGTTGFPKGAIHLHHDMLVAADLYATNVLGLREDDVSFSVAKLFFAYGLGNGLYFPLRTGGTTIHLADRPVADKIFRTIDTFQPTIFYSVPTNYVALLHEAEKTGRTSLGRVRMCVSAGETLPRHVYLRWLERFGLEILDGIGSTEILHIFIANRPGAARPGSTGQVVPGFEARIVDADGAELPPGQVGTLMIRGESVAAGYWNKHEQTKQTFCGEWINTHDKFMVDQDGYFWYSGRTDDMLKVSGQAVWPSEVEAVIQQHPAVYEAGVTGAADDEGLLKPVAYVVLKEGLEPSAQLIHELQEFVKKQTNPHKYPRAVLFVDTLPKTATGKIKRYELRQRAAADRVLHSQ